MFCGQQRWQNVLDTFKTLLMFFKWPLLFNNSPNSFKLNLMFMHTSPGLIPVSCRRRRTESLQNDQQPPTPPFVQPKQTEQPGSPRCAAAQEREAGGNAASPKLKIEGRVLCFWQRNRSGISPPTSSYVGPTTMEGNMLQNHGGSKLAMRTETLLKMPEESSLGQEAMQGVMEGQTWLIKNQASVSWGCYTETSAASKESF